MVKKILLFFGIFLVFRASLGLYENHVSYHIDNNRMVFDVPMQHELSSLQRILIVTADNDQYVAWDYEPSDSVIFNKLKLPRKIVFGENPFPYPPSKNLKNQLKPGNYQFILVMNVWSDSDPKNARITTAEKIIETEFCVRRADANKIAIC